MSESSGVLLPKDVRVQLQYLADDPLYKTVKPVQWTPASLDRSGKTNVRLVSGEPEVIRDVRGIGEEFDLDRNGFCYVKAPTSFEQWDSETEIGKNFIPEMEKLLRREVGECDEILIFDFRLRKNATENFRLHDLRYNTFAKQVHVDRTEPSVVSLVRKNYELKAEHLLAGRVRLINLWRPIKHAVHDCPLAVADGGALDVKNDVVEIDRHNLNTGEFWDTMGGAHYREGYKWYYMSEQTEEDVLLFKNYDSDQQVSATTCLHTAFDLPEVPENSLPRESIEVRALVFTYPDGLAPAKRAKVHHHPSEAIKQQSQEINFMRTQLCKLDDEVHRNKDLVQAVVDLRQWESRKTAERLDQLLSDRDNARGREVRLASQLDFLEEKILEIYDSSQLETYVDLHHFILETPSLFERMSQEAQIRQSLHHAKLRDSNAELLLLREQLEAQRVENQRLKSHMHARVEAGVDEAFESALKEALRQEREKDQFVIQSLRQENQNLRSKLQARASLKW